MVKPGDTVRVKVLEVDRPRKRIALTLRLDDEVGAKETRVRAPERSPPAAPARPESTGGGALAEALRRAAKSRG